MKLKSFTGLILMIIMISLLASCRNSVTRVTSGKLTLLVDHNLQTSLSVNDNLKTPLSSGFIPSEVLVVNNSELSFFPLESKKKESVSSSLGAGMQYRFKGVFKGAVIQIEKTLTLTVYENFPDVIFVDVSYENKGDHPVFVSKWINNRYRILQNGDDTLFWSFQGQSTEARADWILPVSKGFYQRNYMGMNNTDYGGGVPVSDVWRRDIGVAVGHLSLHPELVSLPVSMKCKKFVQINIEKNYDKELYTLATGGKLKTPQTFVMCHHGDAFNALRKFSEIMQKKGITLNKSPETAYEPVWCAWGYGRKFTMDEVVGTLPKVKELGIKWVVIDDGYQIGEGNWNVDKKRFPEGNEAMKKLVKTIHDNGLKAKLWWAPLALDPCMPLWNDHYHDILLLNEDTSPRFITWWDAYYMSPVADITVKETKKVLDRFFDEWDFDGLKMDGQHMNNVPPDYNENHHLEYPEEAPQKLPDFFKMVYVTGMNKKKNAVIENCPCGCCINYYNLSGMNQAVSSDPLSSWQIRLKGKVYHALNPDLAYYGDHVELSDHGDDFASSIGVGAVPGTKFTWPKDNPFSTEESFVLTPEKEEIWKKWFDIYNQTQLSKGEYLGNLYDIGFDKPETHVIRKKDTLFYAFYADKWDGKIVLKGLDKSKIYQVIDYVNQIHLDPVEGVNPVINTEFDKNLLIKVYPAKGN